MADTCQITKTFDFKSTSVFLNNSINKCPDGGFCQNEYAIEELVEALVKAVEFYPDCGGDFCWLVDPSQPEDDNRYDCRHRGYCKNAFKKQKAAKVVLDEYVHKVVLGMRSE